MVHEAQADPRVDPRVTALRDEFRAHHSAYMPGLLERFSVSTESKNALDATLGKAVIEGMSRGRWIGHEHEGLGREVILDDVLTLDLLHFVANAPAFLALIREVTGCAAITRFEGRVYRMIPGTDHFDSWHSDAGAHRMVGMSVNLGPHPYEGGTLQLRTRGERAVVRDLPNTVPGGAILFRISPDLSHRVTPVTGTEPKTAFAGWFLADGSEYFATLLGAARKQHARSLSEG